MEKIADDRLYILNAFFWCCWVQKRFQSSVGFAFDINDIEGVLFIDNGVYLRRDAEKQAIMDDRRYLPEVFLFYYIL